MNNRNFPTISELQDRRRADEREDEILEQVAFYGQWALGTLICVALIIVVSAALTAGCGSC